MTYQAARAGLSAGASVGWQGLSLSLSGYDQRLPELAALVADSLRTFDVAPLAFERRRAPSDARAADGPGWWDRLLDAPELAPVAAEAARRRTWELTNVIGHCALARPA